MATYVCTRKRQLDGKIYKPGDPYNGPREELPEGFFTLIGEAKTTTDTTKTRKTRKKKTTTSKTTETESESTAGTETEASEDDGAEE